MIIRIVRMTFHPANVTAFKAIFEQSKQQIRHFEGCLHLELWQDSQQPHIIMTYSHWASEAHLAAYRQSELFQQTWAATKVLFAEKPLAFSSTKLDEIQI